MRRLVLFLALPVVLLTGAAAFNWWVDPFGLVWKPSVLDAARRSGCLVSQELIGPRYWSFKHDVFAHRPTRTFVVGSSRVLKIAANGDTSFANLGYPGTSPSTILRLFRSLPARPAQTVYVGVEAFWFNANYIEPETNPDTFQVLQYLLARKTFTRAVTMSHESETLPRHRWKRELLGRACVLDRFTPSITWRADGSRVWGWELDPQRFPKFGGGEFTGDLHAWRNGYYADWKRLDLQRVHDLVAALDLARTRGWHLIGFAPPEPAEALRVLETDPRVAPQWSTFEQALPQLFHERGFRWVDTVALPCASADFPDLFHTDARCSARLRRSLTSTR
jgi:hypothetical protein